MIAAMSSSLHMDTYFARLPYAGLARHCRTGQPFCSRLVV